jgi:Fis family transcriptional regulator
MTQRRFSVSSPVRACIREYLESCKTDCSEAHFHYLYRMVMDEVERVTIEEVLEYTQGNQTKSAQILGINRSTLRKKIGLILNK